MNLNNLEKLLEITIPEDKKPVYEARLEAAIDVAKEYCNRDFLNDAEALEIPPGAQMGIAEIVRAMGDKSGNVASQSLEGVGSQSFFQNGIFSGAMVYLKPYRKVRFI